MKFIIKDCVFCGWCGDKAVISKDNQARLFSCYIDTDREISKKSFVEITISCKLDADGTIWITDLVS